MTQLSLSQLEDVQGQIVNQIDAPVNSNTVGFTADCGASQAYTNAKVVLGNGFDRWLFDERDGLAIFALEDVNCYKLDKTR
jgi:hypothetical protein